MIKKLFMLTGVILMVSSSYAQWSQVNSPTQVTLNDVDFINSVYGIIGGDSGIFIFTDDGGINWHLRNTGGTGRIGSVRILNTDTFLISQMHADGFPELKYSTDQGMTWQTIMSDSTCFRAIDVDSRNNNWVCSGSNILRSVDNGNHWDTLAQYTCGTVSLNRISFTDTLTVNAGGIVSGIVTYSAAMKRSEDGGTHLYECNPFAFPNSDALTAFHFFDPDTGMIYMNHYNGFSIGTKNSLVKTYNYSLLTSMGDTMWDFTSQIIDSLLPGYMNDGYFFNSLFGFACSVNGSIYETVDGGSNWTIAFINAGQALNRMSFPDNNSGFAVGDNGTIVKYMSSSSVGSIDGNSINVFPVPASGSLQITGTDSKSNYFIYSADGGLIKTGIILSGEINIDRIAPGIYVLEIISGKKLIRKRLDIK